MLTSILSWLQDEENMRLVLVLVLMVNWCVALAYLNNLWNGLSAAMSWSWGLLGF